MKSSKIKFSNLRAEMAREQVTIHEISEVLSINRDTVSRKLSGKSPIYLNEAMIINKKFFPDKDLHYLFKELLTEQNIAS